MMVSISNNLLVLVFQGSNISKNGFSTSSPIQYGGYFPNFFPTADIQLSPIHQMSTKLTVNNEKTGNYKYVITSFLVEVQGFV